MKNFKAYLPLLLILVAMIAAYFFGVPDALSFHNLKEHRRALLQAAEEHPVLAPLLFILVYITIAALSIPVAIYLTLFGGFLFPQPWSTLYVVIGATLGGCCIFLAARSAFRNLFYKRAAPFLTQLQQGFHENATSYLLFLRLVPLFPYWLVNLAPAFFNVSLRTFFWTTFIGIIPPTFVFTQVGAGLGAILDHEQAISLHGVLNHDVKVALAALLVFISLPLIFRTWLKKK